MRGTLLEVLTTSCGSGIIPAYAGNTYKHRGSITPNPGSSPRMRGTQLSVFMYTVAIGIIPAYAGNTGYRNDTGI